MTATGVQLAWAAVPPGEPRRETAWRLLRGLLPDGVELSNPCPRCGGPHGPVRVAGADALASVSYAGPVAVVGVADGALFDAFGIDAEREHETARDAAGLRGILGQDRTSLRDWTRVEAALKADGRGLRVEPAEVTVREREDQSGWDAVVPGGTAFAGWDAAGPAGVLVSVAVRPRRAPEAERGPATH
ncbi:chemotaxis protein CheY [Microbacterium sp. P5_E9]